MAPSPTAVRWSMKRKPNGSRCWHTRCVDDDSQLGALNITVVCNAEIGQPHE
jgi:hypothetical protein